MTWVRFDDDYPNHRKVAPLNDRRYRLANQAIHWSSKNGTDGRIPADELTLILARATTTDAEELVRRGIWHLTGHRCQNPKCPPSGHDGWVIHDYWDYQPSREKVLREKDAKAERQRKWIEALRRKKGTSQDTSKDASQDTSKDAAQRDAPPSRPAPKEAGREDPPRATDTRRQAAGAAAVGRKQQTDDAHPPPTANGLPDDARRAELAAAARAAAGQARPAPRREPPPKRQTRSVAALIAAADDPPRPAPPPRTGLGFCVECALAGTTVVAEDPVAGSHCRLHRPAPEPA